MHQILAELCLFESFCKLFAAYCLELCSNEFFFLFFYYFYLFIYFFFFVIPLTVYIRSTELYRSQFMCYNLPQAYNAPLGGALVFL